MASALHGLRSGLRRSGRSRGFTGLVVAILGIGIGATSAATNVAISVLLTPLPVEDEARLVLIRKELPDATTLVPFSYAEIAAWREASRTLDTIAGVQYDGAWPWPAQYRDAALTVTGATVTGDFFHALGIRPVVGRLITADDARVGAEAIVVIGFNLWQRQFGGDPGIVGQRLRLNGRPATIVGVAPADFSFPASADAWQPLVAAPDLRHEGWFTLVARLKPDIVVRQTAEEASALLERLRSAAAPRSPQNLRARVVSLKDAIVGDVRLVIGLFVASAALLFLVGCINVVILLLVRSSAREREIAVRAALGATRMTLVWHLLLESAVLALAGGVLGALVAFWLQRALVAAAPAGMPRLDNIDFDGRTLGAVFAGLVLAVLLAGLAPAVRTARRAQFSQLAGARGPTSAANEAGRQLLVSAQLAFALLVTVAGAQLVRTLQQLQAIDLGFSVDNLTVVQVPLVGATYADGERRLLRFEQLVERVRASPGIVGATPVLLRPFTGTDGWDATFTREGQGSEEASANPALHLEAVAPDYFATMGVPLLRGRPFTEADRKGALQVAIVAESLARRAWPNAAAVGRRLKFGGADSPTPWMTVVGVVRDVRYRDLKAPPPAIYVPLRQSPFPPRFLMVRASAERTPALAITQQALAQLDASEPVTEAASVVDLLDVQLAGPSFQMFALTLFAAVAMLLAGVGVFGVLGAFVSQRAREVGVRMALGANRNDVRRLVLAKVAWPVALGLVTGTIGAAGIMPFLRPLLFRIQTLDPISLSAGWMAVVFVTALASLLPVQRAARLDPARLLRAD